jgi:hypothetical protein
MRKREPAGAYIACSRNSRAWSIPRFEAASNSITSSEPFPLGARSTQDGQVSQGSAVGPFAQFNDRARMRALEVLPHPRGPENKYA